MHAIQGRQIVLGQFIGITALIFYFFFPLLCVSSSFHNQRGVLQCTLKDWRKGVSHYVLTLYRYVATNTPNSSPGSCISVMFTKQASKLFRFRLLICARLCLQKAVLGNCPTRGDCSSKLMQTW